MKKVIPVLVAVALIIIIGGIYAGQIFMEKYSYSRERADLKEYLGSTGDDDAPVVLNNDYSDYHAKIIDGGCYMSMEDVDELLCSRFYYGRSDNVLIYTTPTAVISSEIGSDKWSSNDGGSGSEEHPISIVNGDSLWLLLDYVNRFSDFTWELLEDPWHVHIVNEWTSFEQAGITKNTELRVLGGIKSDILEDLEKGEKVTVLEEMENWTKVMSQRAMIGYVENKRLSDTIKAEMIAPETKVQPYDNIVCDKPVVLAWHNVAGAAGNDTLAGYLASTNIGQPGGLNTISPTWFSLADDIGGINSFADAGYVSSLHEKGLSVWGLVDNFTGTGDTKEVLAHADSRARLTDNLIAEAERVGLDGINVDFEGVPTESGEDFIEWIRELSIACRKDHLVLSIDNYVPMGSLNDHYDRKEQGVVADYIIVMAYDEHYKGSSEAGSVASIGYVEDGIRRTVAEVPPEKVIGALPFYTRVWATSSGSVDSDALSIANAKDWIQQRGVTLAWDEETCQNYGEIKDSDGTLRQIWMEDAESIRTKVNVMMTYDISGVAAWQLGFETPDIWEAIRTSLGN